MVSKNRSKIDDLSRKKVLERLSRIQFGKIEIIEDENTLSFGEDNSSFKAKIIINDYKFYSELVFGGSIGAAEAFMMKYWDTNDLTIIVRILLQNRSILDEFDSGFGSIMKPLRKLAHWLQRNTRKGSQKNISAHYDLGNDFFETWLDSKMMYSCAIFKKKDSSLEEASTLKIDRICKKLNLKESDHLLEIGTGWGGFAIYAAKNYGCKVTSTTISKEQHQMAKLRVDEEGLSSRVNLLLEDYRDLSGQFDKLVSIEMIEAVGYQFYSDYFKKCSSLLKADGLMVLQAITIAVNSIKNQFNPLILFKNIFFQEGVYLRYHV